ncbi:O-antigen ligase family protein [Aliikangiella sp. IMCC44632]
MNSFLRQEEKQTNPRWFMLCLSLAIIFEFLRPMDSYLSFLSPLKLPGLNMLAMAYIFFIHPKPYLKTETCNKLLICFFILAVSSVLWSVNTRFAFNSSMSIFWFLVAFVFPLMVIIDDLSKLRTVINVWVGTHVLLALIVLSKGGYGPGGIVEDENDVCCALVMAFPFVFYYFVNAKKEFKHRFFWGACVLVVGLAIPITASRGGILGFAAVIGFLVLMSEKPVKNGMIILLFMIVAGGVILASLPEAYVADMTNMTNPEDSTRDERLWSWSIGWVMYVENPWFGIGAGNYPWANGAYYKLSPMWEEGRKVMAGRQAHSVYFTLFPELGTIGVLLFFGILKILFTKCQRAKLILLPYFKQGKLKREYYLFNSFIASTIGFLVCGTFISVLYYPFIWYLAGLVLVSYKIVMEHIEQLEPQAQAKNKTEVSEFFSNLLNRKN